MLECILDKVIYHYQPKHNDKLFISKFDEWSDSSYYVSITIHSNDIHHIEGSYYSSDFNNYTLYIKKQSAEPRFNFAKNPINLSIPNNLRWQSEYFVPENRDPREIAPPYNPPQFDFIFDPKNNCIEYFPGSELIGEDVLKSCILGCQ